MTKDARKQKMCLLHSPFAWRRVTFLVFFSAFSVFFWNLLMWREVQGIGSGLALFKLELVGFFALFTANYLLYWILSFSSLALKSVACFFSLLNSTFFYFIYAYGTHINESIITDVLNTNYREASSFLGWNSFVFFLVFALLPILFILWIRFKKEPFLRHLRDSIVVGLSGIILTVGTFVWSYSEIAYFENNHIIAQALPLSYINAVVKYTKAHRIFKKPVMDAFSLPLKRKASAPQGQRLMVLVLGESARADNFSLYGYKRDTNPLLARLAARNKLFVFKKASSCATYTKASLTCMFYPLGERAFTKEKRLHIPFYLFYLSKLPSTKILWFENDSIGKDCFGICTKDIEVVQNKDRDAIFIKELDNFLKKSLGKERSVLIVFHAAGSHYPYTNHYPSQFNIFRPSCGRRNLLSKNSVCGQYQPFINGYDNTIVYTDYVLAHLIDLLRAQKALASGLLYTSDHGESLGENHMYLHSAPRLFAPKEQIHVPLLLWLSPQALKSYKPSCIIDKESKSYGSDVVMNSILDFLGVESPRYQSGADLLKDCHQ